MTAQPQLALCRVGIHGLTLPERARDGDYGYDVCATRHYTLEPGEVCLVGIGWKLAEPLHPWCTMLVLPRSSTRRKYGLCVSNSPGLVDRFYGEEIMVQVENVTPHPVQLPAGAAFAQLLFVPVVLPNLNEVATQRPEMTRSGFGSTG